MTFDRLLRIFPLVEQPRYYYTTLLPLTALSHERS